MRRILQSAMLPVVSVASRWIDDVIPTEVSQAYLLERLRRIRLADEHSKCAQDVAIAKDLVYRAGLADAPVPMDATPQVPLVPVQELEEWIDGIPDRKVIARRSIAAGTGYYLDQIAERDLEQHRDFLSRSFESLMRTVEVQRQRSISAVDGRADKHDAWMETHDVSIAFCRHSRRTGDMRFVNTACKLLDWAFPTHRRIADGERLARYLLAMAEREYSIKVLFG